MKIIAVDNNYGLKEEAGRTPAWYLLTHSCLHRDNKPLYVPTWDTEFRLFPSLAVRIDRLGKSIPERFAKRYYDFWSFGFSLRGMTTLRRLQNQGLPLGEALAFDDSVTVAPQWHNTQDEPLDNLSFDVTDGTETLANWKYSSLALNTDALLSFLSSRMTFKTGDILYLGFPEKSICLNRDMKIIVNKTISSSNDTISEEICGFNIKMYPK